MRVFTITLPPNHATLTAYILDDSDALTNAAVRPAMLVFPGGGYAMCSDREAEPVALAYLAEGLNAFVLRYSVGKEATFDMALDDARSALSYVRGHAEELRIDPKKVGVIGFSAGGHLAASLGTVSPEKPDALLLGYAVTMAKAGPAMGKTIAAADESVSDETPPTFLFTTCDDPVVPVDNSLSFANHLARHGVYFELHVYLSGAHGLSLAKPLTSSGSPMLVSEDVAAWLPLSVRFLRHVWGDFPLEGGKKRSLLQEKARYSLDMPLRDEEA